MKELTIEEKAKAYDEAIERAKVKLTNEVAEDIFPELKESEDERIRKELIAHFKTNSVSESWSGLNVKKVIAWLEKQGEQKSDKIGPKFHEGEWIVHHGTENIYQVVAVIDNQYLLKYGDNYTIQKCADVDGYTRLWDIIKDAKDGDVLVTSDGSIFLFKCTIGYGCKHYVVLTTDGVIQFNEGLKHLWDTIFVVHPATKEQRDALMKAMADAGYTFDFEKKELKKIEYKPVEWHREDEQSLNACLGYIPDEFLRRWLTDTIHIKYDKPAWSEEDEKCIRLSTDIIDSALRAGFCVQLDRDRCVDWLKSLKLQRQWKPSEEQLKALNTMNVTGCITEVGQGKSLIELYNDLKKLREE